MTESDERYVDPEWVASMILSFSQMHAGDAMSWRIVMLPLPMWMKRLISRVLDRKMHRILREHFRQ